MRRRNILTILANVSAAAAMSALTLIGGIAHAGTFTERMRAEMNSGKDYAAASAAASRAADPRYALEVVPDAGLARSAMNRGLDYAAAWQTSSPSGEAIFSPEQIAGAHRATASLNEGKDYAAAHKTSHQEPPAPARAKAARIGGDVRSVR